MFDCYFKHYDVDFVQFKRGAIPIPVPIKRLFRNAFLQVPFFRRYLDVNATTIDAKDIDVKMPLFLKSSNISVFALQSIWVLNWFRSYVRRDAFVD